MMNRVLFVERSGELRWLARLSTEGVEPKGNQVLIPETICLQAVEHLYMMNRVLFVERSGELRWLARLSTEGVEPKGNQVLIGRNSQSE